MIAEISETTITIPPNPVEPPPVEEKPPTQEFNWLTTLQELVRGREPSKAEVVDLWDRARQWPTCACGQLCKLLPRGFTGMPRDNELRIAGSRFAVYIEECRWGDALITFHEIEARAIFLLNEKESSLPKEA